MGSLDRIRRATLTHFLPDPLTIFSSMNANDSGTRARALETDSTLQTFLFFSVVLGITGLGSYLMADYLWHLGWTFSSAIMWFLFTILFGYLAFGFSHAAFGFFLRRFSPTAAKMPDSIGEPESDTVPRVAIIIPVYNEPVERVFAGLGAIFDSVMREPEHDVFDFFILSDSNQPEQWVEEEAAWMNFLQSRNAQDRVFYRRRPSNVNKKSGNVSDFCRTWGDHYRYMIVLDADSIVTGSTLTELYRRMESHPRVALIQTAPGLVGGESLFGRMQQFANRLYGPVFMEGLAFWQQCGGNFWGHNAIIRLRPFIEHCDLPELPGRKPFGGHILSHDFVEAGLLRRAGWEVWIAQDLEGSYEEGPQGIIESAQRDRRWCQGNLQHAMLLFARELRGKTRIHLANGILGYVASPIWLLFMSVAFYQAFAHGDMFYASIATTAQGLFLLVLTLTLLFMPKFLCLVDLAFDKERRKGFGGMLNAFTSSLIETFFSALLAPVLMLFHTKFVIWNILGKTVGWAAQRRGAQGTSWDEAITTHGFHTLLGIGAGIVAFMVNPILFWWLSPVLTGLWLSIPISVWTSRKDIGMTAKREQLFLTPEEQNPPVEVTQALTFKTKRRHHFGSITDAVLDPYLNAVHVSLLRRARRRLVTGQKYYGREVASCVPKTGSSDERRFLAERLLRDGPESLSQEETMDILSDIDNMLWMHREAWLRPNADLSTRWQKAISVVSAAV
ncbi:MAG: glucans biosynthesis glucosyltransferase MdoH [Verrucomicrobiales bacterium]|nr:glucans biosynthesis glucosyltransferase MdoH [Verrucomicrobiales bacterium]